jgi:hypothetical protein
LKPPKLLVSQIQELKMKVVPSSSTVLVKLKDAIQFSGGCSIKAAPAVGVLPPRPPRDISEVVSL